MSVDTSIGKRVRRSSRLTRAKRAKLDDVSNSGEAEGSGSGGQPQRMLHQLDDPALTIIFKYLPLQDKKNCREVSSEMNTKIMLLDSNLLWRVDMMTFLNSLQSQKDVVINSKMKIHLILPEQMPRQTHVKTKLKTALQNLTRSAGDRIVELFANGAVLDKLNNLLNLQKLHKLTVFHDLELANHKCINLKSVLELNAKSVRVLKLENIDLKDTEIPSKPMPNVTTIELNHCKGKAQLAAIFNMSKESVTKVEINHIDDTTFFEDLDFKMDRLKTLSIVSITNIELTSLLQRCCNLKVLELSAEGIATKIANNRMSCLTHIRIELIQETTLPINLINSAAATLDCLKLGNVKLCPEQDLFVKLPKLKTLHLVCCSPDIMAALIKVASNLEEVWFDCLASRLPQQDWKLLPKLKTVKLRCNYNKSALKKSLPKHVKLINND